MAKKNQEFKSSKEVQVLNQKSIMNFIPFDSAYEDGIIEFHKAGLGKSKNNVRCFSKMFKFDDANFITETEDKQEQMLLTYQKMLNAFPENVSIQFVLLNTKMSDKQMEEEYYLKYKGDNLDDCRSEYNKIIREKIDEGNNNIRKDKYFILTLEASDYPTAQRMFGALEVKVQENFKSINRCGFKPLSIWDRLEVMYYITHNRESDSKLAFNNVYSKYFTTEGGVNIINTKALRKDNRSSKSLIAPTVIAKNMSTMSIRLDKDRYCTSYLFADFPNSLDTSFLTNVTNAPCEMVTFIDFTVVKKKKAQSLVKNQNVSVKAEMIDVSKKAMRQGISPELVMNEDLIANREEAGKLRNDVIQKGKKLFLCTFSTTIFAESEEQLKVNTDQFILKCADESLRPQALIGQQENALKTAMLTGGKFIIQDRLLTSDNVIAINPFNIQEIMDKHGHFYGINSISHNMVMCLRRETKPVANGLVFGQSGSGKSFITKGEIIPNYLDTDDKIIILDPDNEYRPLAEKFGGFVVDLKTKTDLHINPFDMNMEYDEKDADPLSEKKDYAVGLVESIMGKGRECNSFEVNAIHRAVAKMYEPYITEMDRRREEGRKQNIDISICPTMVDFYNCLIAESTPEAQKVAVQIEPYCVGSYNIFAHRTNIDTSSRLIIYNLQSLPDKMKEMAMKVCLANIWTEVAKNREENKKYNRKRAVWVYMDEFHLFFQTESSASTIQAYFKRVRKYNGIMTGITQDVADLVRTPQGQGMFNNSGFFIILNQLPAGRMAVQRSLDISDTLIDYIADKPSGVGLLKNNNTIIPINYRLPNDNEIYKIMSTNANEIDEDKAEDTETVDKVVETFTYSESNEDKTVESNSSVLESYKEPVVATNNDDDDDLF